MNRRSFLGSILAAAMAPAIVHADSLMRIRPLGAILTADRTATDIARLWREAYDNMWLARGAGGVILARGSRERLVAEATGTVMDIGWMDGPTFRAVPVILDTRMLACGSIVSLSPMLLDGVGA